MMNDEMLDDATLDALEGRAKSKRSIDARWMLRLISDLRASREQVERMRGVVEAARVFLDIQRLPPSIMQPTADKLGAWNAFGDAVRTYEESNDAAKS